jgi:hypothetical protein
MKAMPLSTPALLLKLEGLAILIGSLAVYVHQEWSGLIFAALFLTPDLSMLGYLLNPRIGARTYNAAHVYALPLLLLVGAFLADQPTGMQIALIWLAHIGADRLLGFGLKYETDFKDTHLQRV